MSNIVKKTISARLLGELFLTDFCPLLLWLKAKFFSKGVPFTTPMPGIVSSLDRITKERWRSILEKIKENKGALKLVLFNEFGKDQQEKKNIIEIPIGDYSFPSHKEKGKYTTKIGEYTLVGIPDLILDEGDNSIDIIDFKSVSKINENQEKLLNFYEAQLNAYKYLLEKNNPDKKVKALYLVYLFPEEKEAQKYSAEKQSSLKEAYTEEQQEITPSTAVYQGKMLDLFSVTNSGTLKSSISNKSTDFSTDKLNMEKPFKNLEIAFEIKGKEVKTWDNQQIESLVREVGEIIYNPKYPKVDEGKCRNCEEKKCKVFFKWIDKIKGHIGEFSNYQNMIKV